MNKKMELTTQKTDLLVDLTFHDFPASLISEFAERIVKLYYGGNINAAVQDLLYKVIAEQDFVLSHITHTRRTET